MNFSNLAFHHGREIAIVGCFFFKDRTFFSRIGLLKFGLRIKVGKLLNELCMLQVDNKNKNTFQKVYKGVSLELKFSRNIQ